ncbi:SDR family NAD(P)-dependent oxidoreductase [Canibacter zhoujuaniae]|uniref:SDR family NAD(P)-dependent oxidoreductase n=1 Tax=Canibacter zhoujuaniae TaxID=2708343 RepID=UPI0014238494|nr:SDR family oxidoreductase [Canibacter zhoujuaniae]
MLNISDLSNQTVLVTGANGNLGRAIAKMFVDSGARVFAHARTEVGARAVAEEIGATPLWSDLSGQGACAALIAAVSAHGVRLTGLINCAALQPVVPFNELDVKTWEELFHVNVTVVHELSRRAAERMSQGAWITHIASVEALRPAIGHSYYASAKAAVVMHAQALALELGAQGVRVNAVSPGLIERPGIAAEWSEGVSRWEANAPLKRLVQPQEVAAACVMLASPFAAAITGHNLVVDAGMTVTPGW